MDSTDNEDFHEFLKKVANYNLAIKYFALFSRSEYAFKRAGYLMRSEGEAEANWDGYSKNHKERIKAELSNEDSKYTSAFKYILDNPPKKQYVENGELKWKGTEYDNAINCLNISLRRVRNNLFHGGKYSPPINEIDEIARNEELLSSCIKIIEFIISIDENVSGYFKIDDRDNQIRH